MYGERWEGKGGRREGRGVRVTFFYYLGGG
jgi:hypothetical protein